MRRFESVLVLGTATAVALSGCGGEGAAPNPPDPSSQPSASTEACTPGYDNGYSGDSDVLPTDDMHTVYYYDVAAGADRTLAERQSTVGSIAVSTGLTHTYCVTVGKTEYAVSLGIPGNMDARTHEIVVIPNSKQAGEKFNELGRPIGGPQDISATNYGVTGDPLDNHVVRQGSALSVVGQETDGVGLWQNIATERCQALDMTTLPMLTLEELGLYRAIKEAVCNTLGRATDRAMLGMPYSQYMADNRGMKLLPPLNNSGHDITYPRLPQAQYTVLADRLD